MCEDCIARRLEEEKRAKKEALAEAFQKRNEERLAKQELASKESAEESAEGRASSDNNDDSGKESKEESVVDSLLQFQTMALDAPLSYREVDEMLKELPLLDILRESWWTFFRDHVFPGSNAYAVRFPRAGDVLVTCSLNGEFECLSKVSKVEFGNVYLPNGVTLVPAEKGGFLKFGGSNGSSWLSAPLTRAYAEKLLKGTTECPRTSSKGKGRPGPCLCYLVGRNEHSDDPWETPKKECTVEDIEAAILKRWPQAEKIPVSWPLFWCASFGPKKELLDDFMAVFGKNHISHFHVKKNDDGIFEIRYRSQLDYLIARKVLFESIERDMRRVFQAEYSVFPRGNQTWHGEVLRFEDPEGLVDIIQRLNIRPKFYDFYLLDYGRVDFRYTLGDPKFPPYSPVNQPIPQRDPQ